MSFDDLPLAIKLWAYRISIAILLSTLDDPAWMAMMFC